MRRLTFVLAAALVARYGHSSHCSWAHPHQTRAERELCDRWGLHLWCDVRVHGNVLDFLDKAGEFKRTIIAGNFVLKVTNLETDASLMLNISGQFIFTPNPDNSPTLAENGRNLFLTMDPRPFVVLHRGRVLTETPSGDLLALVFNESNGRSVDICQTLAGGV
jgi:hypothetical protein